MKRGQVEARQLLLVFELVLVLLICFNFYYTVHREAAPTSPELEQQLVDLALKTPANVEGVRLLSPSQLREEKNIS